MIGYEECKGVWNKRNYPIIWYSDNWNDTKQKINDFDFSIFDYETIFELIRKQNPNTKIFENYPKNISSKPKNGFVRMSTMFNRVDKFFKNNNEGLAYSYYLDPDATLHGYGVNHKKIFEICREINERVEEFAKNNPDTLVIVFADHSHIDVEPLFFNDLHEFKECVQQFMQLNQEQQILM